jgi:metal-responsive CopG/Arc/MetJ family transcriptional regulator
MLKDQLVGFRCPRQLLIKIDKQSRKEKSNRSAVILKHLMNAYNETDNDSATIEALAQRIATIENQMGIEHDQSP